MKILVFCVCMSLVLPVVSDARCRTVGESASLGSEYGTFPLYPAERLVAAGQKRDSVAMQWAGYGIGLPLFVVAMPFAMVGGCKGFKLSTNICASITAGNFSAISTT